ncbi:hypothetical protein [Paenibacillus ginsengihumi]|uniref:hypothetical protein n=1 Tax=Paenibacillus ginsengihumi TaxID=431596 RepID=UPI00035FB710|nr:hypothetical protein [Paenibacillus ginsengihumi]
MKRIVIGMLVALLAAAALAAAALWYVRPKQELDWSYEPISLRSHVAGMLAARQLEITLSEAEIDSLLKQALAGHMPASEVWQVTGVRFSLQGQQLIAAANLTYRGRLPVGARLHFALSWQAPLLRAEHTRTEIGRFAVPAAWLRLKPLEVDLEAPLPRMLSIRSVEFPGNAVRLSFTLL